jgi:hypothetical protein
MTPNPRLHPVSDKGETSAGVANREVLHPTAQDRIDLLDHPEKRFVLVFWQLEGVNRHCPIPGLLAQEWSEKERLSPKIIP